MKALKTTLAVLLFLCLLKMPYGYYQLIRFISLIGFLVLSYNAKQKNQNIAAIIYLSLALLFQPIFKIALGRELWNLVDLIVAVYLLVSMFWTSKDDSDRGH
ncbi:hypothetical protein QEG73_14915 [Chitinophagaceae bacterium 26-R-25]|nr:hypothetical protein [Chitinophagaceae bacterium 26-R-25]